MRVFLLYDARLRVCARHVLGEPARRLLRCDPATVACLPLVRCPCRGGAAVPRSVLQRCGRTHLLPQWQALQPRFVIGHTPAVSAVLRDLGLDFRAFHYAAFPNRQNRPWREQLHEVLPVLLAFVRAQLPAPAPPGTEKSPALEGEASAEPVLGANRGRADARPSRAPARYRARAEMTGAGSGGRSVC